MRVVNASVTPLQKACGDLGAVGNARKAEIALSDIPSPPFLFLGITARHIKPVTSNFAFSVFRPSMMNGASVSAPALRRLLQAHARDLTARNVTKRRSRCFVRHKRQRAVSVVFEVSCCPQR